MPACPQWRSISVKFIWWKENAVNSLKLLFAYLSIYFVLQNLKSSEVITFLRKRGMNGVCLHKRANRNFSELSGRARRHPYIYFWHGGRLIVWWIFRWNQWTLLTHIKWAIIYINYQSIWSVISLWLSETLKPWAPPFSCRYIRGMLTNSGGEGSLACHTYCDTGHPFIMVISEGPWHHTCCRTFGSGAVTTCLTTYICRGWDSNIQPSAWEVNALSHCATAAP